MRRTRPQNSRTFLKKRSFPLPTRNPRRVREQSARDRLPHGAFLVRVYIGVAEVEHALKLRPMKFVVHRNGQRLGTYTVEEIGACLKEGSLEPDDIAFPAEPNSGVRIQSLPG